MTHLSGNNDHMITKLGGGTPSKPSKQRRPKRSTAIQRFQVEGSDSSEDDGIVSSRSHGSATGGRTPRSHHHDARNTDDGRLHAINSIMAGAGMLYPPLNSQLSDGLRWAYVKGHWRCLLRGVY